MLSSYNANLTQSAYQTAHHSEIIYISFISIKYISKIGPIVWNVQLREENFNYI